MIDLIDIGSATQDRNLLDALAIVRKHRHARRNDVLGPIDLGFASQRWQSFIKKRARAASTGALEVCVSIHLADALQAGDLYVVDAEDFADYRGQLLPWKDCQPRQTEYCAALGIAENGVEFAAALMQELTSLAEEVDAGYPANSELSIDRDGTPHLKELATSVPPKGLAEFEREVLTRMPERHLLDVLKRTEHCSRYTRHFGPPSGSDPKLANATQRYLFAVFATGAISAPTRRPVTALRSPPPRSCAASTRSTSAPTSWRRRWSI